MKRYFGTLLLDFDAHQFSRDGADVGLAAGEVAVLQILIDNPGRVLSRTELLDLTNRGGHFENSVDQTVSRIRVKLGTKCIGTVRGVGYRWDLQESSAPSPAPSETRGDAEPSTDPRVERLRILEARLVSAMTEPDVQRARHKLEGAVRDAVALLGGRFQEPRCALAASSGHSELARLATAAADRLEHRRAAIGVCKKVPAALKTPALVARLADAVVDHFYDRTAREERPLMQGALAAAEQSINAALGSEALGASDRATLLSQLASLRGCKVLMGRESERLRLAHDAIAPARRATTEAPEHPGASMALGQALHAWARYANSELEYFDRMKQAEAELVRCLGDNTPLTWLVLARFFRQSNRPTAAVRYFERYERTDPNRRRVLSESHVAGEAALLLWYQRPEAASTVGYLRYSRDLLSEAIDWGFEDARLFVALARIEAAVGNVPGSQSTLARLGRGSEDTSTKNWVEVVRLAQQAVADGRHDFLAEAFYLGLDDAMVWNALGTYAKRFAGDVSLATSCYETALRRDPGNPYARTNLARNLLDDASPDRVAAARRHIEAAAKRADWSFVWWRPVAIRIEELLDEAIEWPTRGRRGDVSFLEIVDRFDDLAGLPAASQHEAHLAEILHDLFRLSHVQVVTPPASPALRLQVRWNGAVWTVIGVCGATKCDGALVESFLQSRPAPTIGFIVVSMVPVADDVRAMAAAPAMRGQLVVFDEGDLAQILDGEQRIEQLLENRIA
jgi:DNA-binding winged helix-turn-helix (wHTH) protein/tetratricopeptide (TPR) repeat protein